MLSMPYLNTLELGTPSLNPDDNLITSVKSLRKCNFNLLILKVSTPPPIQAITT
jgi:hypothetical protein